MIEFKLIRINKIIVVSICFFNKKLNYNVIDYIIVLKKTV